MIATCGNSSRVRPLLAAASLFVSLCACGSQNEMDYADAQQLADRIRHELPQVQDVSVRASGNGFTYRESIDVSIHTSSTNNLANVRAQARHAAQLAWRYGKARAAEIRVSMTETSDRGGGCSPASTTSPCRRLNLTLPADAAHRLWGEAEEGDRKDNGTGETFDFSAVEWGVDNGVPPGWVVQRSMAFRRNTEVHAAAPPGLGDEVLRTGTDAIAAVYWREHPDRVETLRLYVAQNARGVPADTGPSPLPEQRPILTVDYTAEQLLARFGPRAADLAG